jgi:hypothetical protein
MGGSPHGEDDEGRVGPLGAHTMRATIVLVDGAIAESASSRGFAQT